jgi:hypothetical protein
MPTPEPEPEPVQTRESKSDASSASAGARRPSFATNFPRTPELDALVSAFAMGDYARVRLDAPKLASASDDPEVKRAARLLRARIEADPLAVWLLVATGALLLALTAWWVAHGHAPAGSGAPSTQSVEHVH